MTAVDNLPSGEAARVEAARLSAVRRYDILDTPPDGAFDRVTALAARFCNVPISTITIVDEDRIWFKSSHGIDVAEIAREPGLCASAIFRGGPHVVTDASVDPRTLNNSLVREALGLRFYVGIPLETSEGYRLGTLNIIDVQAREVTDPEIETLTDLAAIVVDELELRLAARRTIELEAAREAAEFRDRLLAGISHDMRTSLAVIRGITSLDGEDAEEDRNREILQRRVRHLDWLVSQFMHFTKLESGSDLSVDPTRFDVGDVVADAAAVIGDHVPVSVEVADELPPALADPDLTRHILIELLNNAGRFSPAGGKVTVTVEGTNGQLHIAVADEGPGISAADQERVFDRFHRGPTSTGRGIGLYVSRALAESQNGSLELCRAPDAGTCFVLTIPAAGDRAGGTR